MGLWVVKVTKPGLNNTPRGALCVRRWVERKWKNKKKLVEDFFKEKFAS